MAVRGPVPIRIPLTQVPVGLEDEPGPLTLFGLVFFSSASSHLSGAPVILLRPGGSYSTDYWHQMVPGYPPDAYSCALYLAGQGYTVVVTDHLGTGKSSRPRDGRRLTTTHLAQANAFGTRQLRAALEDGSLSAYAVDASDRPLLAQLPAARRSMIAFGHSMGAMLLLLEAGQYAHFDAVGFLGWSCQQLAVDDQAVKQMFTNALDEQGYVLPSITRPFSRSLFYLNDVPTEVVSADEACATVIPSGLFSPDYLEVAAQHAALINVPVFHALGSLDVSTRKNVLEEVGAYREARAAGITFLELAGSAHCHNYATTRHHLWKTMAAWIAMNSTVAPEQGANLPL